MNWWILFVFHNSDRREDEECYAVREMKEQIHNLQQDLETRGDAFEKLLEEHKQLLQVCYSATLFLYIFIFTKFSDP